MATDAWAAYQAALEARYSLAGDSLMQCSSWEQYLRTVGFMKALEDVLALPELVLKAQEVQDDHTRKLAERRESVAASQRARDFGSRLWERHTT